MTEITAETILLILCLLPLSAFILWALFKDSPADIAKKRLEEAINEDRKKR